MVLELEEQEKTRNAHNNSTTTTTTTTAISNSCGGGSIVIALLELAVEGDESSGSPGFKLFRTRIIEGNKRN